MRPARIKPTRRASASKGQMTSYDNSATSVLTPAVLTLDTQHPLYSSPTAWIGGFTAFFIAIKAFMFSMSGMSGYTGTVAMNYNWNAMAIGNNVFSVIVMLLALLGIILVAIFASASTCCSAGSTPLARKSFRHIDTIIGTHVVHFAYGAFTLIVRIGYSTLFAGTTVIPTGDKSAFYYFHGLEFVFGVWALGAFLSALPALLFPEADSRRAAAYASMSEP